MVIKFISTIISDVASGWVRWAKAHPEFGTSVNPIPTKGADYAHQIAACPLGFENLPASLYLTTYFKTGRLERVVSVHNNTYLWSPINL